MSDGDDTPSTGRDQDLRTLKIPASGRGDLKGFNYHQSRKEDLGLTWLEYINSVEPDVFDDATLRAVVRDAIDDTLDDTTHEGGIDGEGVDVDELVARIVDGVADDVKQSAYQGAKEAIQEAKY